MTSKSITLAIATFTLVGANGQALTGTVKDDSGATITGTVLTVAIRQTNTLPNNQASHAQASPGFNVSVVPDATGAFSVANVPPGTYWVCAYAASPGYLSNCDWSVPPRAVVVSAAAPVPASATSALPLTLVRGTIVTLDVNDPGGKIGTEALNSGDWFYPGVMDASGNYSSARPSSASGTHHYYVATIPPTASLSLFVDSDLTVLDGKGNAVATRTPTLSLFSNDSLTSVGLCMQALAN